MKILRLFCLLVVAGLFGCSSPKPNVEVLRPAYLDAIRPIQVLREKVDEASLTIFYANGWEKSTSEYMNVCTAGSINRTEHYWLTAAHCVTEIGPEGRYIEGLPVELVEVSVDLDLAVVKIAGFTAKELVLQVSPPRWNQEIVMAGHPLGYKDLFLTRGYIGNPVATIDGTPRMIFDIAGAPGNSGSPILNLKGEVVSVLQIGWGRSFGPVCGGVTFEHLKKFAHYFSPRTDKVY